MNERPQIKCENQWKKLVTQHITKYVNSYTICTVKPLSNASHETEEREFQMQETNGCREILKYARNTTKKNST